MSFLRLLALLVSFWWPEDIALNTLLLCFRPTYFRKTYCLRLEVKLKRGTGIDVQLLTAPCQVLERAALKGCVQGLEFADL